MTTTITVHITDVNGEPMMDGQGMALMFGVSLHDVNALVTDGDAAIPNEWVRQGKRRAKEALAHSGSNELIDYLQYWARQDHDADVEVIYK